MGASTPYPLTACADAEPTHQAMGASTPYPLTACISSEPTDQARLHTRRPTDPGHLRIQASTLVYPRI